MRRRTALKAAVLPFASAGTVGAVAGPARADHSGVVLVAAGDMNKRSYAIATGKIAIAANPDIVATLGDQQYPSGSLSDYRNYYDSTPWGSLKHRTRPVPGHHEYESGSAAGYFTYFGVQPWYAYHIAPGWRGYALNSHTRIAEQAQWVRNDLAAHPGVDVVASWSDPRYASGTKHRSEPDMQPLVSAFAGRSGIVLNGHEHHYERFAKRDGLHQFIVGTGGNANYPFGTPLPGSRARITGVPGVLVLRLQSRGQYTWAFKDTSGRTRDSGEG